MLTITSYYTANEVPLSLSNLVNGISVVELRDIVEEIDNYRNILSTFNNLYLSHKIFQQAVECVAKANGRYRIKFSDDLGNVEYLDLKLS